MSQDIAPVIVVLNEIALGEPYTVSDALPGNTNSRNGEVASLAKFALDAILRKNCFVQCRRTEIMRPIHLQGTLPVVIRGGELRNNIRRRVGLQRPKETAVDAVLAEVFVHANEVLGAIDDVCGIEYSAVDHRRRARQVLGGGGSTSSRENVICSCRHGNADHVGWDVSIQYLGSKCAGVIRLRECRERGVRESDDLVACRSRRTQGFYPKEEEKLVMGNNRPTDRPGEIVAMEGIVGMIGAR